jgi:hypothetical protein
VLKNSKTDFGAIFRGRFDIPEKVIVQYRAIVKVDFLSAPQTTKITEFFNTIGHNPPLRVAIQIQ